MTWPEATQPGLEPRAPQGFSQGNCEIIGGWLGSLGKEGEDGGGPTRRKAEIRGEG